MDLKQKLLSILVSCVASELHFSWQQTSRQTNPIHLGGQSSKPEGGSYDDDSKNDDDSDNDYDDHDCGGGDEGGQSSKPKGGSYDDDDDSNSDNDDDCDLCDHDCGVGED